MEPNSDRLLALYQHAHLFVLPSLGECFGVATIEAMAAGLPVIASAVGGTADIIDHGENGFILRTGDSGDLAAAIGSLLHDEACRLAMGHRSRQLAEERFDLDTNSRRTLDCLKELPLGVVPRSLCCRRPEPPAGGTRCACNRAGPSATT